MSAFFGRKISKQGVNVINANPSQLILEENYDTGTTTYYDINGNVVLVLGQTSTGNYGISSTNGQFVVSNNGVEQIIIGKLPDGTFGMAVSKPGIDVRTAFS